MTQRIKCPAGLRRTLLADLPTRTWRHLGCAIAFSLIAVGCGTSADSAAEMELVNLRGTVEQQEGQIANLNSELQRATESAQTAAEESVDLSRELEALSEELKDAKLEAADAGIQVDALKSSVAGVGDQNAVLREERSEAEARATAAEAEMMELRTKYDAEIRAELQAAVAAEVDEACSRAISNFTSPVETQLNYQEEWALVADFDAVLERVASCAGPERSVLTADATRLTFAVEVFEAGDWVSDKFDGGVSAGSRDSVLGDEFPSTVGPVGWPATPEQVLGLADEFCGALRAEDVTAAIATTRTNFKNLEHEAYTRLCPEEQFTIVSGGTHIVGTGPNDIPPGRYRSVPGVDECYWERTREDGGIIDNDFVSFAAGGIVVNVGSSDASVEFGCGRMVKFG